MEESLRIGAFFWSILAENSDFNHTFYSVVSKDLIVSFLSHLHAGRKEHYPVHCHAASPEHNGRSLVSSQLPFSASKLSHFRVIPMIYEVLVMGLALHKAAEFWSISAGFSGLTLVKIVVFDQVIYFFL